MSVMNILVITTLYPNKIQFRHGIFVETRIRKLQQSGKVAVTVIAPVPWFPCKIKLFPQYSKLVDIPSSEIRHGIKIYHPRYLVVPKIGMLLTPIFLAWAIYRQIQHLKRAENQSYDLIDSHYYYPDGVACALVAKVLNIPLTITARGSDINLITDFALPRKMILWASRIAAYNLAVCNALKERMIALGVSAETAQVVRNGVDLELFKPLGKREELRKKWPAHHCLLVSVGNLIESKGHHLIIEAMLQLPDYELFIVGSGEWHAKLDALAQSIGVQDRVRFLGEMQQNQLVELYNCADVLILASSREGWANVLLEAMACGTPVIVTNVGGANEIVLSPEAGILFNERNTRAIVEAINQLFANYPERSKTRFYAEKFTWDETTQKLLSIIEQTNTK